MTIDTPWSETGLEVTDAPLADAPLADAPPAELSLETAEVAEPLRVTFGAEACHLTGRGAAALLALAQALDASGAEIILPSLVCPSVPLACLSASLTPVYADVLPADYTIDPAHVAALIGERTIAILAVHLFGHPCDVLALRALADRHGILLIEDCAQSLGQLVDGVWLGKQGDAAICSFHPSKILRGAGGGALLLQHSLAELSPRIEAAIDGYPLESRLPSARQDELRRSGNAILNAARLDPPYAARYQTLIADLCAGIPMQISAPQLAGIHREWELLDRIILRRELRAERYRSLLADPLLVAPTPRAETRPLFRYSLTPAFAGDAAVFATYRLTAALREAGFHASNLYFPVHRLMGATAELPVADRLGRTLINLWLDESATAPAILGMRRVLERTLHHSRVTAPPFGDN